VKNLAELLVARRETSADKKFGVAGSYVSFGDAFDRAAAFAQELPAFGLPCGSRVALVGANSLAYLTTWAGLQMGGVETALVNPTYPDEMLAEMLARLEVDGIIQVDHAGSASVLGSAGPVFDLTGICDGTVVRDGDTIRLSGYAGAPLPGVERDPGAISGFIHTSGTTGVPKFCALSHDYHLRLARFIADSMTIGSSDTVFAPLPLFHINPLGYGIIGGLLAGASVLGAPRFSASGFWPQVIDEGATIAILHLPPVEILKKRTTRSDSAGHSLRAVLIADSEFLETFEIPVGVTGYGSTEAAGLTHARIWRRDDQPPEDMSITRYVGDARPDLEWKLADDDEILVRGRRPHVLFDGYQVGSELTSVLDADGWFATGDLGRIDPADGSLIFVERKSESIRVKGEFVPIELVEQQVSEVPGVADNAVWKTAGDLNDDQVVLYLSGESIDVNELRAVCERLPSFMRPRLAIRVTEIPRDDGVGKVRRRQLAELPELERVEL
jgi:carnitine-CoA ligase